MRAMLRNRKVEPNTRIVAVQQECTIILFDGFLKASESCQHRAQVRARICAIRPFDKICLIFFDRVFQIAGLMQLHCTREDQVWVIGSRFGGLCVRRNDSTEPQPDDQADDAAAFLLMCLVLLRFIHNSMVRTLF